MELMRSRRVVLFSRTTPINRVYPINCVKATSKVAFLFRFQAKFKQQNFCRLRDSLDKSLRRRKGRVP